MKHQRGFAMTMALYLIGAVAVVAVLYGVYWKIDHSWETTAGIEKGRKEVQLAWDTAKAEQRAKEAKQIDTAVIKHEAQREKTRTIYRTITKSVDKYIDRPIYRNLCFDEPGLRDANSALRGSSEPAIKPNAAVPAVDGTGKRDGRGSPAKTD